MPILSPLSQFIVSARHGFWLIAATSLSINLLLLGLPIYALQIFDRVLLSRSMDTLWMLTLAVSIAMLATALLDTLRGRMLSRLSNRLAVGSGPEIFSEIMLRAGREGERSVQLLRDLGNVRAFLTSPQGLVALIDAPMVPLFLGVVYLIHPWMGHVTLLGLVVMVVLAWITDRINGRLARSAAEASMDAHRSVEGYLQSAEAVAAMGMTPRIGQIWQQRQNEALALGSLAVDQGAALAAAARGARLFLNVAQTGLGAYLAVHDEITIGAMVAANILSARGLGPMEQLITAGRQLATTRLAWPRIEQALKRTATRDAPTRLPAARGELVVSDVTFVPPGAEQPSLRGITFALPPGAFLGLIGPSSAGKSTLARLICGVWLPRAGAVSLDGAEVRNWHPEDFGRATGYLPQDVQLMAGTVRQNIARFTDAADEAVVAAAQAAGAHDMILGLPQSYETRLAPGALNLSAGQRQRVGLARALFGEPNLIVLDEPNSNLDAEGEQALLSALERAKARGATLIVVSHRPALLAHADLLGVLVGGKLQHFGPKAEILKRLQAPSTNPDRHAT